MTEQKLTGYPHIDRPWMKYYDDEKYHYDYKDPETSVPDYIRQKNAGNEKLIALTYYGKKITYGELFKKWNEASRALVSIGCREGSRILYLVPNIPESGIIWMGAAQIGAVSNFIDPRPDTMDMQINAKKVLDILKHEKTDYIIALDKCYLAMLKPIEDEIKSMGIRRIIILSATESMSLLGLIDYLLDVLKYNSLRNERLRHETVNKMNWCEALINKIRAIKKEKTALRDALKTSCLKIDFYSDLVKKSTNIFYQEIKNPDLITYIGHTSGTSGARPKPICLTSRNQISATEQFFKAKMNYNPGESVLHELPYFAPMGTLNNYVINLACGANSIEIPEFEINEFGYLLLKYKPICVVATPAWLASLPDCKYLQKADLSMIKRLIFGGDSMTRYDEERVNNFMYEHGSRAKIEKGHGMSEYGGGACFSRDKWSEPETIGIPLPDTIYSLVDSDVDERLVAIKSDGTGIISGELVVSSPALTPGVLDGEEIVKHYKMDGMDFIRTRDLARMRPDGVFIFEARKDRSFTRFDGYKIKPYEIESVIEADEMVNCCRVVEYFDKNQRGNMPIAHIVLNENMKYKSIDAVKIVEHIVYKDIADNPTMSSRQIPSKFKFRKSMPLSKNGKVDFNALIKEGIDGTEINVEVQETNLSIAGIKIY